ncbi:hypothetical protein BJ508DRAFT_18293 [Ascobolus immersus RN42]|uniref:Uncharacterized protein n=1 Tax=Ascobolus immersus RN42 TaxID=1160509 RepID=A0A3N4I119_ASCIM|nr:hypothetical protein BJ508DRAFT_18293 [Ascobolus immersus RN42]
MFQHGEPPNPICLKPLVYNPALEMRLPPTLGFWFQRCFKRGWALTAFPDSSGWDTPGVSTGPTRQAFTPKHRPFLGIARPWGVPKPHAGNKLHAIPYAAPILRP